MSTCLLRESTNMNLLRKRQEQPMSLEFTLWGINMQINNLLTIVYLVGIRMFWKNIVPKLHQYESSEEETTTTQAPWTFLKNNCMINLVFFCRPDYWLVETPSKYIFWVGHLFVEEVELNHWLSNELCDGISESKRVHSECFVAYCGLWQKLLDSGQAEGAKMGKKD